jgi:signal transduction histidine kinase
MSEPETSFKTITVGIAPDAIEQIAKVPPDRAVEELIWNAIDAEATRIEVIFYENKMKGIDRIVVSDNGHGIPVEAVHQEAARVREYSAERGQNLKSFGIKVPPIHNLRLVEPREITKQHRTVS